MRVIVLNPVGQVGGAERVLLAGLRTLREEFPGSNVLLIVLQEGPLAAAAQRLGATVQVLTLPKTLAVLGDTQYRSGGTWRLLPKLLPAVPALGTMLNRLRSTVRNFRPHLIHAHGLKAQLLTRFLTFTCVPIVGTIHDFVGERPLASKLLRRVSGLTHTIAISEAVRRDLSQVLPGLPCRVVPNPVDAQHFCPSSEATSLVRDKPLSVGLVATYANWKGHKLFLDALALLKDEPVHGLIVGGPLYNTAGSQVRREELEAYAEQLGLSHRVSFLPFQSDPREVYRSLDVVVHASTRPEPFGLTILEAMACGKPVIVSAAGGAVELFEDGVSALGFPMGQAADLAQRIRQLRDPGLRQRLGLAARERALQYDQPVFARRLAEFYRSLVPQVPASG